MPREPISQIFENPPEFCPIDGLQKSRVRDQRVAADTIDIPGRGSRLPGRIFEPGKHSPGKIL